MNKKQTTPGIEGIIKILKKPKFTKDAVILSYSSFKEDHGIPTFLVEVKYDSATHQGFGMICLESLELANKAISSIRFLFGYKINKNQPCICLFNKPNYNSNICGLINPDYPNYAFILDKFRLDIGQERLDTKENEISKMKDKINYHNSQIKLIKENIKNLQFDPIF